jgi:hypothetical protein
LIAQQKSAISNQSSLLMQQILDRTNLYRALKQVTRNKGASGVDGITVEQLPEYLKHHWGNIQYPAVTV